MEFNFNSYDNSKQSISYCEVLKCPTVVSLMDKNEKLRQCLTNIKELVENDWCYHHESCKLCTDTGSCINKQVLLKISECEVENA